MRLPATLQCGASVRVCVALGVSLCALLLAASASAKPLGAFDCGAHPPAWATVCTIPDWATPAEMAHARWLSETRGLVWWLQLGYAESPVVPIGPHAARVRARVEAAGLLPYIAGMSVGEEWYEHWRAGSFAAYGLTAENPAGQPIITAWLGMQHAAAKSALGLPVVWITTAPNNDPAIAPYQPIPAGVDLVAVDAYVGAGGTFATHVAPVLAHAERTTPLPLVLVPQFFDAPGWERPTPETAALYLSWLARPRWVALVAFTWRDRPSLQMTGLASLPALRAALEAHAGRR